jgi:hypothetical protein
MIEKSKKKRGEEKLWFFSNCEGIFIIIYERIFNSND